MRLSALPRTNYLWRQKFPRTISPTRGDFHVPGSATHVCVHDAGAAYPSSECCAAFFAPEQFIYALGPIAHMQDNSKYFSSKPCPRPAVMPRVTIQMPVRAKAPIGLSRAGTNDKKWCLEHALVRAAAGDLNTTHLCAEQARKLPEICFLLFSRSGSNTEGNNIKSVGSFLATITRTIS